VFCNVRELENVLLNLAFNARDAMPMGGRLCISANRGREDEENIGGGPIAILRVTDTGCGMSPEDAKRAFTPYFTTKGPGRGTGLGLAMVSEFARRAGGSAEIETEIGFGTSVVLRLPGCEPLAEDR
jgi:signal transduction histidine kinase